MSPTVRRLTTAVALVVLTAPLAADAQQTGTVYRLGILTPAQFGSLAVIVVSLRELGYVEGQNLVVERRSADGKLDRLPGLARELVRLRPDVIVASSAGAIEAARGATRAIPIIMGFTSDPVGRGFVASLARPGGNITGVSYDAGPEITGKRLELIREAVPRAVRIAVLSTREAASQSQVQEAQNAASRLGVELVVVEVRDDDYDRAFAAMTAKQPGALFVLGSPILNRDRKRIIALAAKHRLPAIYEWREHVDEGGLMAYGSDISALYRRVAAYVDRIFKGANPADLPVEQPTKLELVINLKTARLLGLVIPSSLMLRADQVID
jgi:putative tryptophan/tyrosine transport system substrate-binding protein